MKIDVLQYLTLVVNSYNVDIHIISKQNRGFLEKTFGRTVLQQIQMKRKQAMLYYVIGYLEEVTCIFQIPKEESEDEFVVIGPYKKQYLDLYQLHDMMKQYQAPCSSLKEIEEYYHSIPMIADHNAWEMVLLSTVKLLYGTEAVKIQFLENAVNEEGQLMNVMTKEEKELSFQLLEERYRIEQELLQAVSKGNIEKALDFLNQSNRYKVAKRYKETNRNYRNLLISFNTLCRKAIESACVHPVYMDEVSTKFAKQIETVCSETEALKLKTQMVRKYCMLVINHSLRGYSPLIQKVIHDIEWNLAEPLTLKMSAEKFCVNASYLSDTFKKEVGETFTSYVNRKRIQQAIFYLNTSQMQVQEIASEVGMVDVNYFIKLFKKIVGKTPKEYRNSIVTFPS